MALIAQERVTDNHTTTKKVPDSGLDFPALVGIAALAFALRFGVFRPDELGLDGHLAVGLAAIPIPDMLAFNLRDVHPPLFYLLLRAWFGVVGLNLLSAKWFVVAAGTLSVLLAYRLARRRLGPQAGLVGALVLAVSPSHVFLSATVRDFAPGLLLSLFSLYLLDRWYEARERRPESTTNLSIALALVNGAAMATWYFHGVFVAAQLASLLGARRETRRRAAAVILAGVALCGPWLTVALSPLLRKATEGVTVGGGERQLMDVASYAREMTGALVGTSPLPWEALFCAYSGLFVAGSVLWGCRGNSKAALANLFFAVLGLAIVYVLAGAWVQSLFVSRYFLVPLPFLIVGQAALFTYACGRWRPLAAVALLALVLPALNWFWPMVTSGGIPYRENGGYRYLEAHAAPGDSIVFTDTARLGYYLLRNSNPLPSYAVHFAGSPFLEDNVPDRCETILPAVRAESRHVWLFNSQPGKEDLAAQVETSLGEPISVPVVISDQFSYVEITAFAGDVSQ